MKEVGDVTLSKWDQSCKTVRLSMEPCSLRNKRFQSSYSAKLSWSGSNKKWKGRGKGEEETFSPLPLPRHFFFFCSCPNVLDELARNR